MSKNQREVTVEPYGPSLVRLRITGSFGAAVLTTEELAAHVADCVAALQEARPTMRTGAAPDAIEHAEDLLAGLRR